MSKIYAFIVIVPFMALLLFKGILLYEFDTKQRYIKDIADSTAYVVKITGVLSPDVYSDLRTKLNKLAVFDDADIIFMKGEYMDGTLSNLTTYVVGTQLQRGDAFMIYIRSSGVSNYSRLQNGGVNPDDTQNLHYSARAQCRVEYVP
jgi:hypothetical protein